MLLDNSPASLLTCEARSLINCLKNLAKLYNEKIFESFIVINNLVDTNVWFLELL
jgi:hypothetical protein